MVDDHRGDRELSSPMKVRELIALLKNVDPKDAAHQDPTQDGELKFNEPDRKFLRRLHIK